MVTTERAMESARRAAQATPVEGVVERLAAQFGAKASVDAVFGASIVQESLTVIPVARVRWGFGGGGGSSDGTPTGAASGSGGGGGVAADPVGYLEITADGATFRPIREPYPSPAFLLAAGVAAAALVRALAQLRRR